jgi:iron complex transport system permease protein
MTKSAVPGLLIAFAVLIAGLLLAFTVGRYPVSLGDFWAVISAR